MLLVGLLLTANLSDERCQARDPAIGRPPLAKAPQSLEREQERATRT